MDEKREESNISLKSDIFESRFKNRKFLIKRMHISSSSIVLNFTMNSYSKTGR